MENEQEVSNDLIEQSGAFELGTWVGRRQAFGVVAAKCSAADIECLKKIRDEKMYKAKGLDWAGFCRQYAGIAKSHADRLIRELDEFGPNYFQLTRITRISADSYRAIAGAVSDEGIEFGGEKIALTAENSGKIVEAVAALKESAGHGSKPRGKGTPGIGGAEKRIAACLAEIEELRDSELDEGELNHLKDVVMSSMEKFSGLFFTM